MGKNGAKVVSSAILGMDFEVVGINGKRYVMMPPTIHRIAGAGYYLAEMGGGNDLHAVFSDMRNLKNCVYALSFFINGDESLANELSEASFEEVVAALETALSLISTQNFTRLSTLARNVQSLTAKQRP